MAQPAAARHWAPHQLRMPPPGSLPKATLPSLKLTVGGARAQEGELAASICGLPSSLTLASQDRACPLVSDTPHRRVSVLEGLRPGRDCCPWVLCPAECWLAERAPRDPAGLLPRWVGPTHCSQLHLPGGASRLSSGVPGVYVRGEVGTGRRETGRELPACGSGWGTNQCSPCSSLGPSGAGSEEEFHGRQSRARLDAEQAGSPLPRPPQ